jgi:hypothetical protein
VSALAHAKKREKITDRLRKHLKLAQAELERAEHEEKEAKVAALKDVSDTRVARVDEEEKFKRHILE